MDCAPQVVSAAEQQSSGDAVFPLVYQAPAPLPVDALRDWVSSNRETLLQQTTQHGGVLLRGAIGADVEAFDAVVAALGLENFPYDQSLSNAVRVNRTDRVFSANEAPPEVQIFFHHEMAQTPLYPRYIFFFCEVAPESGGATPLVRSDWLLEQLRRQHPQFVEDCQRLGLKYTNVMPGHDDPESGMGRSWQKTLRASDRAAAEARLGELGYSYTWLEDDCLRATTPVLPAVMEVAPGRWTFFNQLIAAFCGWKDERNDPSQAIRFGDDHPLDPDAVRTAIELSESLAYDHAWQPGDVVLLDNTIVMHARRSFTGRRKVLASLAQMQTHAFLTS